MVKTILSECVKVIGLQLSIPFLDFVVLWTEPYSNFSNERLFLLHEIKRHRKVVICALSDENDVAQAPKDVIKHLQASVAKLGLAALVGPWMKWTIASELPLVERACTAATFAEERGVFR